MFQLLYGKGYVYVAECSGFWRLFLKTYVAVKEYWFWVLLVAIDFMK